jgi:hypothetical protein
MRLRLLPSRALLLTLRDPTRHRILIIGRLTEGHLTAVPREDPTLLEKAEKEGLIPLEKVVREDPILPEKAVRGDPTLLEKTEKEGLILLVKAEREDLILPVKVEKEGLIPLEKAEREDLILPVKVEKEGLIPLEKAEKEDPILPEKAVPDLTHRALMADLNTEGLIRPGPKAIQNSSAPFLLKQRENLKGRRPLKTEELSRERASLLREKKKKRKKALESIKIFAIINRKKSKLKANAHSIHATDRDCAKIKMIKCGEKNARIRLASLCMKR